MAYEKTLWKDRVVEKPNTYRTVENPDGTITLYPITGQVIEKGTPISAANLNKIENGIVEVYEQLEQMVTVVITRQSEIEKGIERIKNNGGGTMHFGDGEFIIPTMHFTHEEINKSLIIKGNGIDRTHLKFLNDINEPAIKLTYVNGGIYDLTLEGLRTSDDYNEYQKYLNHHGININNCTDYFEVKRCKIKKFRANGISAIGASNLYIKGNQILDCYGESILTSINGIKAIISNNICENSKWCIDSNVIDTVIKNNRIINCENAITFENMNHDESEEGNNYYNTKDGIISENNIINCVNGINVSTANFKYKVDNVVIENNTINLNCNKDIGGMGITLDKVTNIKIKNNIIRNAYAKLGYPESANGIYIQDGTNIEIKDNKIDGAGRYGIALKDMGVVNETNQRYKIQNIEISSNKIYNILSAGICTRNNICNLIIKDNEYINNKCGNYIINGIEGLFLNQNNYINCQSETEILTDNGCINATENNIAFLSGWRNHITGKSFYSKVNGIITVSLICQTTENITNKNICTLPIGYRPKSNIFGTVSYFTYENTSKTDIIKIDANGNIELLNSISGVSLLGFSINFYEK